jgi:hypothetical protein
MTLPSDIQPVYLHPQRAANEPVVLYEGAVVLRLGADAATGTGELALSFLPSTGLRLAMEAASGPAPRAGDTVEAAVAGGVAQALVVLVQIGNEGGASFSRLEAGISRFETGASPDVRSIGFQVLNFPDFLTPGSKPAPAFGFPPKVADLEAAGWRVRLSAVENSRQTFKSLKETGGFAFTHLGLLERVDGRAFNATDGSAFLDTLAVFLSFARGAACSLPVRWGSDATGTVVWQCWGSPIVDAWRPTDNWFDEHHGSLLTDIFPGFYAASVDPDLAAPFRLALHWYQRSNMRAGGMEGAIILGVTNLDLLGGLVVVDRAGRMTDAKFDGLTSAEKLAELLATMKVAATFPAKASELAAFAAATGWADTVVTLTETRHGYVHPNKRRRKVVLNAPNLATFYTWRLSLWYQELALLHLLGHRGIYRNRMKAEWRGEAEQVPWA